MIFSKFHIGKLREEIHLLFIILYYIYYFSLGNVLAFLLLFYLLVGPTNRKQEKKRPLPVLEAMLDTLEVKEFIIYKFCWDCFFL